MTKKIDSEKKFPPKNGLKIQKIPDFIPLKEQEIRKHKKTYKLWYI